MALGCNIDKIFNEELKELEEHRDELRKYYLISTENAYFIDCVLYEPPYKEYKGVVIGDLESSIGTQLRSFILDLGFDYNLEGLVGFIGNFFYDDCYYYIDGDHVLYHNGESEQEALQGATPLIDLANKIGKRNYQQWLDFIDSRKGDNK